MRISMSKLKLNRLTRILLILVVLTAAGYFVLIYDTNTELEDSRKASRNYFLEADEYKKMGFIVDTPTCKIPDIDIVHSSIRKLIQPPHNYKCEKNRRWSFVKGQKLYLNTKLMEESGYPLHLVTCCYRSIHRVEQDPDAYNKEIDSIVEFSTNCTPIAQESEPTDEFILVVCKLKSIVNEFENIYLYKYFHAIAQINKRTKKKLEYWNSKNSDRPPNIIIVGMDSTSRLNFNRQMPQTLQTLKELEMIEMYGYTKVGYNTFPNSVPYFSGYSAEQLNEICMYTPETKQDLCPYIWKRFDEAKYLTAHVEDSPLLMAFSNFKIGFVQQPTDYYLRTLMLAIYKNEGNYPLVIDCIGNQTVDEVVLLYMEQLLEMSKNLNIPIFLSSWLTNVAHDSWNQIHEVDNVYANFFKNIRNKNLLSNSILFVMGDHGYNYGIFRETFSGWYESKLPNMKIIISQDLKQRFPKWISALKTNSRRLTSPYDLYWTMSEVLDTFTTTSKPQNSFNRQSKLIPRQFGQSLLKEIGIERSCETSGISNSFCACTLPVKLSHNNPTLHIGANFVINYINKNLLSIDACAPLKLQNILGGSMLTKPFNLATINLTSYIITFDTSPGGFVFETDVYYSNSTKTFSLSSSPDIQRLSKFNTDVSCISNSTQQLYCYCN